MEARAISMCAPGGCSKAAKKDHLEARQTPEKSGNLTPARGRYSMHLARKRIPNLPICVLEHSGHQMSQILEQQGNQQISEDLPM